MAEIFIKPAAENDLINIWLYIAWENPEAADRVYQAAEDTFRILAASPRMGVVYHPRRTRLNGVRSFPIDSFPNFIVYYTEHSEGIEIIRVLHSQMDRQRRLKPEG